MNLVESIRKDLSLLEAPLEMDYSTVLQLTANDGNKGPNWAIRTNVPQDKIMEWAKDLFERVLKYYRTNRDRWFDEDDDDWEVAQGIEMLNEFKKAFGKDYRIDEPRSGERRENIQLAVYLRFDSSPDTEEEYETRVCDGCDGTGMQDDSYDACPTCDGTGEVEDWFTKEINNPTLELVIFDGSAYDGKIIYRSSEQPTHTNEEVFN